MRGAVLLTLYRKKAAVIVDADHYLRLSERSWSARRYAGGHVYATGSFEGRSVTMHRYLMGDPAGFYVDHINGDTLDNRLENLRLCSHAENTRNRRLGRNNKSGFKGVYHHRGERWRAQIGMEGKLHYLGLFDTREEAAAAYDEAAKRLHGDFAALNLAEAA